MQSTSTAQIWTEIHEPISILNAALEKLTSGLFWPPAIQLQGVKWKRQLNLVLKCNLDPGSILE